MHRRSSSLLLLWIAAFQVARAQQPDKIINELFGYNTTPTNTETKNPGLPPGADGQCDCVPYYLCNNDSKINTEGIGIIDIRGDEGPCASYLEVCCNPPDKGERPITPRPVVRKGCGVRKPEGVGFRITGNNDNEAQFGELPWMVAIIREEHVEGSQDALSVYQCGGALIHPQVVLTAAHCVTAKKKRFKIRAGEWDTQTTKEVYPYQDRYVTTVVIHPDYYAGALFNDVALLILDAPVELTDHIDVICLPPQGYVVPGDTRCYASGWGKDVFEKEGKYQVILKRIDLPVVDRDACQESLRKTRLGKYFELDKSFICAGGERGKDTCSGDGGSPLVCPIPGRHNQYLHAGIVAWGIGCGEERIPGVYANVPLFRNWIDTQMSIHNLDPTVYQY